MKHKRITIFAGNFGSGKTELSINFSVKLAHYHTGVVLVDLDVINPYFRSREKLDFLEERDIEVIFPKRLARADLPVISPDIHKIIQSEELYGVFDIGGNDDGAVALGSVSRKLKKKDYEMNLVVNTLRPQTNKLEGIIEMKEKIAEKSRLEFDNLVCNINLGRETEIRHMKKGYPLVKKAAEELGLPIKFIAVKEDLLPLPPDFQPGVKVFPVKIYMNPPWVY